MALTRVRGSAWDTQDNLVVDTLPELSNVAYEGIIFVSGAIQGNDGNGGWFKWEDLEPRSNHDGFNIIDPTGTTSGRGCWVRQQYSTDPPGKNVSEVQMAATGQTDFRLQHIRYAPGEGSLAIYVNGTRLTPFSFTETAPDMVTINMPLRTNDVVEFIKHENPAGGGTLNVDAGQVNFDNTNSGIQSVTVQGALDELDAAVQMGVGSGTGTGGAVNAKRIPYLGLQPDQSNNVQDGMHWIQRKLFDHVNDLNAAHRAQAIAYDPVNTNLQNVLNVQDALDAIYTQMGSGDAVDVGFDNTQTPQLRSNVQQAMVDLYTLGTLNKSDLADHIAESTAAHACSAIYFNSLLPRFNNIDDTLEAIEKLSSDRDTQIHEAGDVTFDITKHPLGATVQLAVDGLADLLDDHKTATADAHTAEAVSIRSGAGLSSSNVLDGLLEINTNLENHKVATADAHDAAAIKFGPTPNPLTATNVEAAILEAASGKQIYLGSVDATAPYIPPTGTLNNNDYYTVQTDGVLGAGWTIGNLNQGDAIKTGDKLIWDNMQFWHVPDTTPVGAIISNPTPGQTQSIVAGSDADKGLVIAGSGQRTIPLLTVAGGDIDTDGTVSDGQGNLRQTAAEVPYSPPTGPQTTVKAGLDNLKLWGTQHLAGAAGSRHNADTVDFTTNNQNISGQTVQRAVESVQRNLETHQLSLTAHSASGIIFLNNANGIPATNVQAAIEATWNAADNHAMQTTKAHPASAIGYDNTATGLLALTMQEALDELYKLEANDVIDGGSF
jgi:hypothetical protein